MNTEKIPPAIYTYDGPNPKCPVCGAEIQANPKVNHYERPWIGACENHHQSVFQQKPPA